MFKLGLITGLCFILPCQAMQPAEQLIPRLKQILKQQKTQTALPVKFPTRLPLTDEIKSYYLHIEQVEQSDEQYSLSVDATPECNGARVCSLGRLDARRLGNPEISYDLQPRNHHSRAVGQWHQRLFYAGTCDG